MHRFLCLILLLLLTSCASQPYSKYLSPKRKIKYIESLEQKINLETNSNYGHVILQYDLIGLGEGGDDPYGSKLYRSLVDSDDKLDRLKYGQKIKELTHQISDLARQSRLLTIIAKNQDARAGYFQLLAKKLPVPKKTLSKKAKNKKKANMFESLELASGAKPDLENLKFIQLYLSSAPLLNPMKGAILTSEFGQRKNPFNKKKSMHSGIDLQGSSKSAIYATAGGVVKFSGERGDYGKLIIIDHGHGYETYYAHLDEAKVQAGERVLSGQSIATQGSSGKVTNYHLHYEIRYNNIALNPNLLIF